jgi:type II secretory pathway predicted ATPase ExeA
VVGKIDEAHLLSYEQLETIRMLTLCRDRDYAGDLHEVPVLQPVCGQPPGIIPVRFR